MAQQCESHIRTIVGSSSTRTTQTVQEIQRPAPEIAAPVRVSVVLRPRKKVSWNEDTVDNEHLQRRSSKICCVYHKKETLEDSSSEEEGDDGDTSGKGKRPCSHHHGSDFAESSEKRKE